MVVPYTATGDDFRAEKPLVWSEALVQRRPLIGELTSIWIRTARAW